MALGKSARGWKKSVIDVSTSATISPLEPSPVGSTFLATTPGGVDSCVALGLSDNSRQAVNKCIRINREFDGVIDVGAVLRDPDHPSRILPVYVSKDHLHPNDAGYQALADAN